MKGDATRAEALRIAQAEHLRRGWSFSVEDIGETAAKIINAMDKGLKDERD